MPLTSIVCPHCERSVEVQTTSVTRSRECPNCGKNIILQLASRDGKNRRMALLTVPREGLDVAKETAAIWSGRIDSRPVLGGSRDRLMNEPEVQSRIKQLKWGLVIVSSMIFLVVGNYFKWWSGPSHAISQAGYQLRGSSDPDTGGESRSGSLPRVKTKVEPQPSTGEPSHVTAPEQPANRQLTDLETAKKAAAKFLAAKTVDERVSLVRDRSLNEKRIRAYYALHGDGPVVYERIEARDVNLHGAFFYTFNVVLKNGTRREIMVGKAKSGQYVIDWASFVLYSEMGWSEFRVKHPNKGVMFRLLVSQSDFFSGEFSNSQELLCLKLINPTEPDSPALFGYLQKSESLGRILNGIMEKSHGRAQQLMLKIAYPENGASDNQVLITEFIGEGWIARNW